MGVGNLGIPRSKDIISLIYFSRCIEIFDAKILHSYIMFRNLEIELKKSVIKKKNYEFYFSNHKLNFGFPAFILSLKYSELNIYSLNTGRKLCVSLQGI